MKAIRITLAAMLMFLAVACAGGGDSGVAGTEAGAGGEDATGVDAAPPEAAAAGDAGETGEADGSAGGDQGDQGVGAPEGEDDDAVILPEPPPLRPGDRVIKEGTVALEVEEGEFDRAFMAVVAAARRLGGDAIGTSTRTADNGDTFGSVTVRVPVERFEDLLVGVGRIGTVASRDVESEDVSVEYTDLQSRLRHLRAQERFYLGLFEDADGVQDAIAVQQQLDGIQNQIEQLEGRVRFLDDRTSFSTLTIELYEPGAGGGVLTADEPAGRPTLARYWDTGRDAFVNVIGALMVAVLFLVPLLIPIFAAWMAWVVLRRPARVKAQSRSAEDGDREVVGVDRSG